MPLQSVLNGAKQCQVLTKRTRLRCKNPAAYGCLACRMHGAHKSRNVSRGVTHPNYKHGDRTRESETEYSLTSTILLTLRDIGDSIGMFTGSHTRGRKPRGYIKFDLKDPEELTKAILATLRVRNKK